MLQSADDLRSYGLRAVDGQIGNIEDFLFDDSAWSVRYIVADTRKSLLRRKVLISTFAFSHVSTGERRIYVDLNKEQVRNAPDVDTDPPISRQQEIEFHNYYGWPYYWQGAMIGAPPLAYPPGEGRERSFVEQTQRDGDKQHLRSMKEVRGYRIQAIDGELGHVEDFIVHDRNWQIRYIVVDTRNWWPGKKVLVSPNRMRDVRWKDRRVAIDLSREEIKQRPDWDDVPKVDGDKDADSAYLRRPLLHDLGVLMDRRTRSEDSRAVVPVIPLDPGFATGELRVDLDFEIPELLIGEARERIGKDIRELAMARRERWRIGRRRSGC